MALKAGFVSDEAIALRFATRALAAQELTHAVSCTPITCFMCQSTRGHGDRHIPAHSCSSIETAEHFICDAVDIISLSGGRMSFRDASL